MSISPPRWQCCPLPDAGWLLPSPAPLGRARPYQPLWLLVLLSPSSHHCTSTTPGEVIPYPGQSSWQIIFPATKQRKLRCWANCPTMTRHYSGHWPAGHQDMADTGTIHMGASLPTSSLTPAHWRSVQFIESITCLTRAAVPTMVLR